MATTHDPNIIGRGVEAARRWYDDLATELGSDDRQYAARALRAVLHALRDRLSVGEGAQLAAQLPTLIRGIYYEQWKPGAVPHLAHDVDEFLARCRCLRASIRRRSKPRHTTASSKC
jgi:uncharacterized protein (DUF2267 family)